MKTPEDEAFEDIERRQGGFQAKRKAAMDKINADFDEEYIKYRTAFPKEYTAASVLGDQAKYGTSWSKDGERIDPMSVYKEPEYAARAFWKKDGRIGVAVTIVRPDGGVHVLQKTIDPPQPEQHYESGWNSALEMAAHQLENNFKRAFGDDTLKSIAVYIKGLKK